MKKFISLMVVAVLVLSMLAGCGKTSVTTDGSTSMEKVIGALGEAFRNDTGISVTYNPTGSGSGIKAVQEGRCDIGLSSRDLNAEEKASGLTRSFTTSATMPSSTTIPVEKLRLLLQS
ncbi:MAG: substrate-binding domain-containing protein, partial [Clostridia bacterium]|nr:substrate-binding domain-containing protein [Clostridia bacterium]